MGGKMKEREVECPGCGAQKPGGQSASPTVKAQEEPASDTDWQSPVPAVHGVGGSGRHGGPRAQAAWGQPGVQLWDEPVTKSAVPRSALLRIILLTDHILSWGKCWEDSEASLCFPCQCLIREGGDEVKPRGLSTGPEKGRGASSDYSKLPDFALFPSYSLPVPGWESCINVLTPLTTSNIRLTKAMALLCSHKLKTDPASWSLRRPLPSKLGNAKPMPRAGSSEGVGTRALELGLDCNSSPVSTFAQQR